MAGLPAFLHSVLALLVLIATCRASEAQLQGQALDKSSNTNTYPDTSNQVQLIHITTIDVLTEPQSQRQLQSQCEPELSPRQAEERTRLLQKISRDADLRTWDSKHPRWPLLEALHGFRRYRNITGAEIDRFEGLYKHVPKKHKKIVEKTINYHKTFDEARSLLDHNAKISDAIVENALDYYNISHLELEEFINNSTEVKPGLRMSTSQALKHMVRDWSVEGQTERNATFPYILGALTQHRSQSQHHSGSNPYRVLVPGAGLGRLAHEIDHRLRSAGTGDVAVTSNEFSAYMNIAYRFIASLGRPRCKESASSERSPFTIYPFVETWSHARTRHELFRPITVPDMESISGSNLGHGNGSSSDSGPDDRAGDDSDSGSDNGPRFNTNPDPQYTGSPLSSSKNVVLVEGDFTREFAHSAGTYDAIATLFFIDTARNLVSYLETIHSLLKPGGVWVNVGPLLYGSAPWVQLSLDEVVAVAEAMGFEFDMPQWQEREVMYNFNASALWRNGYVAQYWVATKKKERGSGGWFQH